jgi:hypothetical protein
MAALSRFISWLREKGLPFFKLLKEKEKFEWSKEADAAFAELKQFLTSPRSGRRPRKVKPCCFTSWQLIGGQHNHRHEREEVGHVYKVQRPVYFINEVLNESKTCYP